MPAIDFQYLLQKKMQENLLEIQSKNPAFSLRAYAKKLSLSPSAVSEILKGKRKVSLKLAKKILMQLNLTTNERKRLLSVFPADSFSSDAAKGLNQNSLESEKKVLHWDQFEAIGKWHHFAILSLSETKGFLAEAKWISSRLKIKTSEAEEALERMHRMGMIDWNKKSKSLQVLSPHFATSDDVASLAIRKSHQEDLELAREKIDQVDVSMRDYVAMTLAIDIKKIPEAKKLTRDFLKQMSALLETSPQNEVYKLCVHLFPLSDFDSAGNVDKTEENK
jgi:uncharacterized protein (TIGR02147 family)